MNIFNSIKRAVFGYDIFISYSRRDSLDYAYSIARHFMKTEHGYDCYIDQLSSTNPGKKIPLNILSALKKSTALIIIGSAGAMNSKPIREEVTTFKNLKNNNPIIPIDIDGQMFLADWYNEIEGLAIIDEKEDSFNNKLASDDVLDRISNSLTFTKKSQKLRRTAFAFLAFFVVSIFISVFMLTQVSKAKKELAKTSKKVREEQMKGFIYLSKITAPVNTISALKYAMKAYTDYRDVDTANAAEKNLLDLYNNNDIVIKNNYSTGGTLSPGGKYINDGNLYFLSTKNQLFFNEHHETVLSPDDNLAVVYAPDEIRVYHLPDSLVLINFPVKDSIAYVTFDTDNHFVFISSRPDGNNDTGKARIRVLDRETYKIIEDVKIPGNFFVNGYSKANGGVLLLQNAETENSNSYIWQISTGNVQQIPVDNKVKYLLVNHNLTIDGLLLEQLVTASKNTDFLKSTSYNFRFRLMDINGKVLEDSVFAYDDVFKIEKTALHTSTFGKLHLFGLNGFWGTSFLLNTAIRPFHTPQKIKFGSLMKSYEFVKLISDKYILAVGFKNDEYNITVFKLTSTGVKEIFSVVSKNHPNGNIEDDYFMKSIGISYCAATNFLNVYDRGEGLCTQYYLDKRPVTSAKELMDLIAKKELFPGLWNE